MKTILFFSTLLLLVNQGEATKPIPKKYAELKSICPVDSRHVGCITYKSNCTTCHGDLGWGDGRSATAFDFEIPDLTEESVKRLQDGELYYKIFVCESKMPKFANRIPEDTTRWYVVSYVKELGHL